MSIATLRTTVFVLIAALLGMAGPALAQTEGSAWKPNYPSTPPPKIGNGTFRTSISSKIPELNRIAQLKIHVIDKAGNAVPNAQIQVTGKARDVERSLPTSPRVTYEKTSDNQSRAQSGTYVVEGLRFNMRGSWLLFFDITADGKNDKTVLEVEIH